MKRITKEEVLALARLAKLELTAEEVTQYTKEIEELLEYFQQLDQLHLDDVEPTISVNEKKSVMRDDVVEKQLATDEELRAILPRRKDNYIQVERMI